MYTIYEQRWKGNRKSFHRHPSDIPAFARDHLDKAPGDTLFQLGDPKPRMNADSTAVDAITGFGVWQ
jgi:hypothetical protein